MSKKVYSYTEYTTNYEPWDVSVLVIVTRKN